MLMRIHFDWGSAGAALLLMLVAFWGYRLLKQRMDHQRYVEQLAELEFEQMLFSNVPSAGEQSQDLVFLQNQQTMPSKLELHPDIHQGSIGDGNPNITASPDPNPCADGPLPADVVAVQVIQQLTAAGLMGSVDGYLELHGNPKGAALLKLRSKKTALLIPTMESEGFYRQQLRRVDMILVMGPSGKALVITPLEDLVASSIFLK